MTYETHEGIFSSKLLKFLKSNNLLRSRYEKVDLDNSIEDDIIFTQKQLTFDKLSQDKDITDYKTFLIYFKLSMIEYAESINIIIIEKSEEAIQRNAYKLNYLKNYQKIAAYIEGDASELNALGFVFDYLFMWINKISTKADFRHKETYNNIIFILDFLYNVLFNLYEKISEYVLSMLELYKNDTYFIQNIYNIHFNIQRNLEKYAKLSDLIKINMNDQQSGGFKNKDEYNFFQPSMIKLISYYDNFISSLLVYIDYHTEHNFNNPKPPVYSFIHHIVTNIVNLFVYASEVELILDYFISDKNSSYVSKSIFLNHYDDGTEVKIPTRTLNMSSDKHKDTLDSFLKTLNKDYMHNFCSTLLEEAKNQDK